MTSEQEFGNDNKLVVTCTDSNRRALPNDFGQTINAPIFAYQPGDWKGDGLDDLYHVEGTGEANELIIGLGNSTNE